MDRRRQVETSRPERRETSGDGSVMVAAGRWRVALPVRPPGASAQRPSRYGFSAQRAAPRRPTTYVTRPSAPRKARGRRGSGVGFNKPCAVRREVCCTDSFHLIQTRFFSRRSDRLYDRLYEILIINCRLRPHVTVLCGDNALSALASGSAVRRGAGCARAGRRACARGAGTGGTGQEPSVRTSRASLCLVVRQGPTQGRAGRRGSARRHARR